MTESQSSERNEDTKLWDGDLGDAPQGARVVVRALLHDSYVWDDDTQPYDESVWNLLSAHESDVRRILNDVMCDLRIDQTYRVAYAVSVTPDGEHTTKKDLKTSLSLTTAASIFAVRLREVVADFEQQGTRQNGWVITGDDILHIIDEIPEIAADASAENRDRKTRKLISDSLGKFRLLSLASGRAGDPDVVYRILPIVPLMVTGSTADLIANYFDENSVKGHGPSGIGTASHRTGPAAAAAYGSPNTRQESLFES